MRRSDLQQMETDIGSDAGRRTAFSLADPGGDPTAVSGRVLWSLVTRHLETGQTEFTNKELRLDRSLELPGFRDNLDTRLVMLKRRQEERDAPLRLERTGRGRFRLVIDGSVRTELHS